MHDTVNAEAQNIIATLGLKPLPREGGWFGQQYVSEERRADGRALKSLIWFLLIEGDFSALHRLRSAESWVFHSGDPVEHVQLDPETGSVLTTPLGVDVPADAKRRLVAPAGVWQGARIMACARPRGWSLLTCQMTPAWAEEEFELADRTVLLGAFPGAAAHIRALTR